MIQFSRLLSSGRHTATATAEPIRQTASPGTDSRRGRYAASVYSRITMATSMTFGRMPSPTCTAPTRTPVTNAATG